MKATLTSVLAIIAISLFSCKQATEKSYNDTVVNMYGNYVNTLSSKMDKISDEKIDKAAAAVAVKEITQTTDSCIAEMNKLKPSEDAKDFHNKVVAVFQLIKSDIVPVANKMNDLKGSEDINSYNKLIEEYNAAQSKLDAAETAAQTAQQAYAAKLGTHIEN